jgi:mRNA-degrading endonuclease RelE of RelBE toxin-antitoxin system
MSVVTVPLCSNLVQVAALKQYQGDGDGEDEHTPALFLEAPYRVGKPLRGKLAGFHSARLGTQWRFPYRIDESKRVVVVQDIQHPSNPYRRRYGSRSDDRRASKLIVGLVPGTASTP